MNAIVTQYHSRKFQSFLDKLSPASQEAYARQLESVVTAEDRAEKTRNARRTSMGW